MNTLSMSLQDLLVFLSGLIIATAVLWPLMRRQYMLRHKITLQEQLQSHQQLINERDQSLGIKNEQLQGAQTHCAQLEGKLLQLEQKYTNLQRHDTGLTAQCAKLQASLAHLEIVQVKLSEKDQAYTQLLSEHRSLQTRREQEEKHYQEQLALIEKNKQLLSKEFERVAHKIFDDKQDQFSKQSKNSLEMTLSPLKDQLKSFREKVEHVYEKENADRNKLVGQISELQKQTQQIGEDAVNLAKALKGDNKAQGNWGEVILERLLEESGLQKGREYETQVNLAGEAGERRAPDVIVRLPENKDIIIDAKVSLVDYERYCSSDDADQQVAALKGHINSMRGHINQLSIKSYENLEGIRSLDFVFIFIPVEAAFMLALQHEPSLFREAYDKQIILVSPTTLLATLRTVESIWRYEKQNKNAEKIARQAGSLYDQFVLLLNSMDDVGRNLSKTQEAFETSQKRLSTGRGNLIKRVEDIKLLGAKAKKQIGPDKLDEAQASEDQLPFLGSTEQQAEPDASEKGSISQEDSISF
jgi:DNA recombination protein RmuC